MPIDDEKEMQSLTAKVDDLTKQLKASEDEKTKKAMEEEKKEAKKSVFKATMDSMDEKQQEAAIAAIKAQDDDDMKKMANDYEEEHMSSKKSRKAMEEEEHKGNDDKKIAEEEKEKLEAKVRDLTARVSDYESERKGELIKDLVTLKAKLIPELDVDIYVTKLSAKTYHDLQEMFSERKDEFNALKAAQKEPERKHFGFKANTQTQNKLTSLKSIMNDGGIA